MSRQLARLKLDRVIQEKLRNAQISTAEQLFIRNDLELIRALDVPLSTLQSIFDVVGAAVTPPCKTAFALLKDADQVVLNLGAPELRVNPGVTELVGPAGVGKTQACLMLCVCAVLQREFGGLGGTAVYVDTESTFSPSRLVQIAQAKFPGAFSASTAITSLTENVICIAERDPIRLLARLRSLEELIVVRNVKLVVVDSIAAPVRSHFDNEHIPQRQEHLGKIASVLKLLSESFRIPIVVTNQVTTRLRRTALDSMSDVGGTVLQAALGVLWAHAVNTRFVLEQLEHTCQIKVGKSPMFPFSAQEYKVTDAGIQLVGKQKSAETEYAGAATPQAHSVVNMTVEKQSSSSSAAELSQVHVELQPSASPTESQNSLDAALSMLPALR